MGLFRGKLSFTMADGGSDDDVIHLASFNVHRSQGKTLLCWSTSTALYICFYFCNFDIERNGVLHGLTTVAFR